MQYFLITIITMKIFNLLFQLSMTPSTVST